MSVTPLFRITSRGAVKPKGGELAPTMRALWDWFDREVLTNPAMHYRPKTILNYRRCRELALSLLGDEHPSNHDVMEWTLALAGSPYNFKPSTVYLEWKTLRAFYRTCNDGGSDVVQGNPCAFMKLARPSPTTHALVNINELWETLLGAMPDDRARCWLAFMRWLGRRPGELRGLRTRDLLRQGGKWYVWVRRQRPNAGTFEETRLKNEQRGERKYPVSRSHPLFPFVELLHSLGRPVIRRGFGGGRTEETDFVFPYRNHDQGELMDRLREVAPLAFPPGKGWRTFRHTLAVEMNRKNASDADVAEMLGSSPEVIRETYIGWFGHAVRDDVMKLWRRTETEATAPPGGLPVARKSEASGVCAPEASRPETKPATLVKEKQPCSGPRRSGMKAELRHPKKSGTTPSGTGGRASNLLVHAGTLRGRQRALPGLAVGSVVRRPRR